MHVQSQDHLTKRAGFYKNEMNDKYPNLMDEKQFQVCLYDCEMDVLLVSDPVELATKGGLSGSGMTVLWLVLNHR